MRELGVVIGAGIMIAALVLASRLSPEPAYVAGAAAILFSAALMGRIVGLDLRHLSTSSVWYYSYLAGTAVPAFFVVAGERTPSVAPYLFAVFATLFTAPLGMLLVSLATGYRREETRAFYAAPLERVAPAPSQTAAYVALLAVSLALAAGYFIETPVVPLLYLIQHPGSAAVLATLREESFKLLDSPLAYAYDVNRNVFYPFLIALSLGCYLVGRRLVWLVLFLITAVTGLFFAAASIAKAPVAVLVLVTALFVYLYRGGRVSIRAAVGASAAVFLFPVLVLVRSLSGLGLGPADIAFAIVRRLFYVPAAVLYQYFVVVPDVIPYLHGRTIGRVQWILGGESVNIANFVFRHMYPRGIESGVANTSFLGYLHADFGVVGVLVGGMFVGILVQGLQVWISRQRKTVATLAAFAFLMWAAWKINFQALPQTLLSGGIIIVLVLLEVLRLADEFFRVVVAPSKRMAHP